MSSDGPDFSAFLCRRAVRADQGMIKWWLDNDMPLPPEGMAHLSDRLCSYGTVDVLGVQAHTDLPASKP